MKVIFMGTPEFAVSTLNELYEMGYEIPLVVTQPDRPKGRGKKMIPTPVKAKASELGIDVYQPEKINTEESIIKLKEIAPDFIVVVAYGQILRKEILDMPKLGCINVHASLLPAYRGAAPINWAIINGEIKTGITTMFMDIGLDTGDMLLKDEINIKEDMTAEELHDELMEIGAKTLIETLKGIENKTIVRTPQDHDKFTYAAMLNKNTGKINWDKDSITIKNLVRGTNPWPGAYCIYKDKKIKIYSVEVSEQTTKGTNGQVFKVNEDGIYVHTNDSSIIIKELQFPGKKRMKVGEYLKGNNFEDGIVLS